MSQKWRIPNSQIWYLSKIEQLQWFFGSPHSHRFPPPPVKQHAWHRIRSERHFMTSSRKVAYPSGKNGDDMNEKRSWSLALLWLQMLFVAAPPYVTLGMKVSACESFVDWKVPQDFNSGGWKQRNKQRQFEACSKSLIYQLIYLKSTVRTCLGPLEGFLLSIGVIGGK